jgi:hypothetical protein
MEVVEVVLEAHDLTGDSVRVKDGCHDSATLLLC